MYPVGIIVSYVEVTKKMICPEDIMIDSYSFSPTRRNPAWANYIRTTAPWTCLPDSNSKIYLFPSPPLFPQSPSLSRSEFSVLIRPNSFLLKRAHLPSQLTTMSKGKKRDILWGFYMGPINFGSCKVYHNHFRSDIISDSHQKSVLSKVILFYKVP